MEAKFPSRFSGTKEWVDEVSGAFVRMEGLKVSAYQDCAVSLLMFSTENQGWPDVFGRFTHGKQFMPNVVDHNKRAGRFISKLRGEIGFDHVWEMLAYNSNVTNSHFTLRFPALVDEVISQLGGGVRIVYDNSSVQREDEKILGFTTKLMQWRIRSGDLRDKEVHCFPAQTKEEKNVWIYVIE